MGRYGEFIGVRVPQIFLDFIRSMGYSISEFVREAVFQRIVEICNDPEVAERLKRQIEVELMQVEIKIAELEDRKEELEKAKQNLERTFNGLQEFFKEAREIIKSYFDDLDELFTKYSEEEVKRFIEARIDALSDNYGYPRSFIIEILSELNPKASDLLG